jgi:hypothetical protein
MKWLGIGVAVVVFALGLAVAAALRSDGTLSMDGGAPPGPPVTEAPVRPPAAPPMAGPRPGEPRESPARDPFTAVDRALETMARANVVFNVPRALDLGEGTEIQLLLSLHKPIRVLQKELSANGVEHGSSVRVSPLVEARLTGLGFTIEALTEQQQPVGRRTDAEWRWEIEGRQAGAQRLHLTLTAFVPVEGVGGRHATRTIDTFDRTIAIEVGWGNRTKRFLEKNWQWLWAAVVVPVAGVAMQLVRRRGDRWTTSSKGTDTTNTLAP